jgi:hypothetical protein
MHSTRGWEGDFWDLGMSRFQGRALWQAGSSGKEPSAQAALHALGGLDDDRRGQHGPLGAAAIGFSRWQRMWPNFDQRCEASTRWIAQSLSLLPSRPDVDPQRLAQGLAALAALWSSLPQAAPRGAGLALAKGLNDVLEWALERPDPTYGSRPAGVFARCCLNSVLSGLDGPAREEAWSCSGALKFDLCHAVDFAPLRQTADLLALRCMPLAQGARQGAKRL